MSRVLNPLLLVAFAMTCAAQDAPKVAGTAPARTRSFVLEAGELGIEDLVESAARFLARNILYSPMELGAGGAKVTIRLQTRMELDAVGCEEMLTTLLCSHGLAITPLDLGRNVYEVIHLHGPRGKEVSHRCVQLSPEEVLRRPMLGMAVQTLVELKHISTPMAINALRPLYGQTGVSGAIQMGNVGNLRTLLLHGFSHQVAAAIRIVGQIDKPDADQPPKLEQTVAELSRRVQWLEQENLALRQALATKADKQ